MEERVKETKTSFLYMRERERERERELQGKVVEEQTFALAGNWTAMADSIIIIIDYRIDCRSWMR